MDYSLMRSNPSTPASAMQVVQGEPTLVEPQTAPVIHSLFLTCRGVFVQEYRMIVLAAERRAYAQKMADVLAVTPDPIRQQFKLLDGICSEAVVLLADKPATDAMFRVLKQIKPFR